MVENQVSPEEELRRSVIYICTTMVGPLPSPLQSFPSHSLITLRTILMSQYREDEDEMRQVIKSLLRLAPELGDVCEAHVFMDGGANGEILQQFALQLVHILEDEVYKLWPSERPLEEVDERARVRDVIGACDA